MGMAIFVGKYEYRLDGQGRLILPPSFRSKLADGAYITSFDNCLALLPGSDFEQMSDRLEERIGPGNVELDAHREFTSNAAEVKLDSQGRIRIKQEHMDAAGLGREVVVVGAGKRAEVWDRQRWQSRAATRSEKLTEAIERGFGIGSA